MKFCEHLERTAASCARTDRSAVMIALLSTWHGVDAIGWRGLEDNPQRTSPTPCAHVRCLRRPRRSPWHPRPESGGGTAPSLRRWQLAPRGLERRVFNFEPTLLILQIVDAGAEAVHSRRRSAVIAGCCALTAIGHAAAAPPSSVMNWRRLIVAVIRSPRRQWRAALAES